MRNLEIKHLYIDTTKNERVIRILLPKDYKTSKKSYPVLYMHDGQNLFEDQTSYSGVSWGISDTITNQVEKGLIHDLIVVGIDNSDQRFFEYSPWKSSTLVKKISTIEVGGLGEVYADFVVNKVKPFIDHFYRTKPDYNHTMLAGSSMGAYISTYIAVKHPNVFKHIGVFSLASWFNEDAFLKFIRNSKIDINQRYFISIGRHESSDEGTHNFNEIYLENSRNLYALLKEKNVMDMLYIETDDIHNESAWKKVFVDFIRFANKKS
ncbi:MAG: alpha/beta hydrolase [Firmicutes bacterium]|nr:alpha/beta hydrolase [Bacillota bacterium]